MKRLFLLLLSILLLALPAHAGNLSIAPLNLDWSEGGIPTKLQYFFNGIPSSITGGGQTVVNNDGLLVQSVAGSGAVSGARLVSNLLKGSQDLTNSAWQVLSGAAKVDATTFTIDAQVNSQVFQSITAYPSSEYVAVIVIQTTKGTPLVLNTISVPSYTGGGKTFYATGNVQTISRTFTTASNATSLNIGIGTGDGTSTPTVKFYGAAVIKTNGSNYGILPEIVASSTAGITTAYNYSKSNGLVNSVAIGDSLTYAGIYLDELSGYLGIENITNKGTSGNTLAQMLARFNDDVVALSPTKVIIQGGVNDAYAARTLEDMQSDLEGMVAASVSANITPILATIPPSKGRASYSSTIQTLVDQYNAWITTYASTNGYQLLDFNSVLADTDGMTLKAAYDSGDHLHPNVDGYVALGRYIAGFYPTTTNGIYQTVTRRTRNGAVADFFESSPTTFKRYLGEGGRTNLFLNSYAPATQTINITATGSYTLSVKGAGSATVAANTATGTGFGTATDGTNVTFSISGTGTIDVTISGSPTYTQVESGLFASSPIITSGTSASRTATVLSMSATSKIRTQNCAIWGRVIPHARQNGTLVFHSGTADTNDIGLRTNGSSGQLYIRKYLSSTVYEATNTYVPVANTPFEYQAYWSHKGLGIRTRYWDGNAWTAWTAWGTHSNTADAVIGSTFEIGSRAGAGHHFGYYPMFKTIFIPSLDSAEAVQGYVSNEANWK